MFFIVFSLTTTSAVAAEPEFTDPVAPGDELSGSSQTFTWNVNDASTVDWWTDVGSSSGGSDLLIVGR